MTGSILSRQSSTTSATLTNNAAWTKRQWLVIVTMSVANLASTTAFSVLAPFFPQEAAKKGVSETVIGFIFGCFELVVFFCSPLFGNYLTRLGSKFSFVTGITCGGIVAILYGFLDRCPDGAPFIGLCFACRIADAVCCALFITASFAVVAYEFPGKVSSVFGLLETSSGVGMMLGPVVGGALFQAKGFGLPFWVLGSLMSFIGVFTAFTLPSYPDDEKPYRGSLFSLLRLPIVLVVAIGIIALSAGLGFTEPTLANHLEQFHLTPTLIGVCFLIPSGVYALSAPLWGWLSDSQAAPRLLMSVGTVASVGAYLLIGPSPVLPLPQDLYVICVGLGLMGLCIGMALVPTFQIILEATLASGLPDNLDTYGLVSGLINACFSLGYAIGPTYAGYLRSAVGFRWASTVAAGFIAFAAACLLLYLAHARCSRPVASHPLVAPADDEAPLLLGEPDYGATNERTTSVPKV